MKSLWWKSAVIATVIGLVSHAAVMDNYGTHKTSYRGYRANGQRALSVTLAADQRGQERSGTHARNEIRDRPRRGAAT